MYMAFLPDSTWAYPKVLLSDALMIAAMGSDKFLQMKEDIAEKVLDKISGAINMSYTYTQEGRYCWEGSGQNPECYRCVMYKYTQETLDMATTIITKMRQSSKMYCIQHWRKMRSDLLYLVYFWELLLV